MKTYAYIRVSTREQNIDRQLAALEPFNLPPDHIFCDHQSGKNFDRPAYKAMIEVLQPHDLVIVKSVDRLGRNYNDILIQWQYITKTIKADIQVLDMELLNTRPRNFKSISGDETEEGTENNTGSECVENLAGTLTATLIADLVLQIMAYFAQIERDSIHQRQAEGIAAAKAKGVRFGRKPIELPEGFEEVCRKCMAREVKVTEAADGLGMKRSTFFRHYKIFRVKYLESLETGGSETGQGETDQEDCQERCG